MMIGGLIGGNPEPGINPHDAERDRTGVPEPLRLIETPWNRKKLTHLFARFLC